MILQDVYMTVSVYCIQKMDGAMTLLTGLSTLLKKPWLEYLCH